MTSWARLTWQAPDPGALAAELEACLGPIAWTGTVAGGGRVLRLGGGDLEVVPWRREAPDDEPHPAGRLVFEPLEPGAGEPDPGAAVSAVSSMDLIGVGWATVELDRAEAELDPWLDPAPADAADGATSAETAPSAVEVPEPHLGARTRVRRSPGLPGEALVLGEPVTEGRLAACLARDGEGPCTLYLAPAEGLDAWREAAAARGVVLSAVRDGPLGRSVLLARAASGPHLIVVDRPRP
jgi:hypothetical protein